VENERAVLDLAIYIQRYEYREVFAQQLNTTESYRQKRKQHTNTLHFGPRLLSHERGHGLLPVLERMRRLLQSKFVWLV
jgi:hypothetical protein